ncbi:ATP-binding protein [Rivularia sp. UHCC 0363]|uniref:ATP-binding protein n=1 Tax=Rivularia sp. UHCC 0363 TaxID=3110244 RepID=UPI002B220F29|nr:ATP-binding protein [Rivularia sp. UHCC 0363]MEA5596872.1 ATP-binding protein [Rivularia sp. UHCC 0363]
MFKKATKSNLKIRLALSGASGSGKTYSALSIASNLGNRIALIDTERGSASKYADLFNFDTCELTNHHPAKYIEAIRQAEDMGYDIIIIDSLTHAWFSELEMAGGRFDGWAKVRPLERKLIDAMIGSRCHIIATMRSKTEWLIEENQKNGKSSYSPKKVGTSPIQASGVEYEFDVAGELDYTHILTISKSRCPAVTDKTFLNPGKELALEFKSWLATVEESQPQTTVETVPDTQDLRVKQIRTLLDYPVELIKEWLQSNGVERPSQLDNNKVDELVKTMCLAWASPLSAHPKYTADSYDKNVVRAVIEGYSEVVAVQNWMNAVCESNRKQKELKAV